MATKQRETHNTCFNIKIQYLFNVMFVLSKISFVKNWKLELIRNKYAFYFIFCEFERKMKELRKEERKNIFSACTILRG